jgi:hypothetical protein
VKGVTSLAFESVWQCWRRPLTREGISIAVTRSQVELNHDLIGIPSAVLESLQAAAVPLSDLIPRIEHLGESRWPVLSELSPLPESRISSPTVFFSDRRLERRLLIDGEVKAHLGAYEARDLHLDPEDLPDEGWHRCVLEVDEGAGFEERQEVLVARLTAAEQVILGQAQHRPREERLATLQSLGLSNDLLSATWDRFLNGLASPEEAISAHRTLRHAFESLSSQQNLELFDRRDKYLDAMDRMYELLHVGKERIVL